MDGRRERIVCLFDIAFGCGRDDYARRDNALTGRGKREDSEGNLDNDKRYYFHYVVHSQYLSTSVAILSNNYEDSFQRILLDREF